MYFISAKNIGRPKPHVVAVRFAILFELLDAGEAALLGLLLRLPDLALLEAAGHGGGDVLLRGGQTLLDGPDQGGGQDDLEDVVGGEEGVVLGGLVGLRDLGDLGVGEVLLHGIGSLGWCASVLSL